MNTPFTGILSASAEQNPSFYNWNLAVVIYCDGGGYAGTRGALPVGPNGTIFLEGARVLGAVMAGGMWEE